MDQYNQQHGMKKTLTEAPHVTAPPPMGYPPAMKLQDSSDTVESHQTTTQNKGSGGFLRGCLAAMCCCCVLDCVF